MIQYICEFALKIRKKYG